jgi:hypothetical protein
MQAIKDAGIVLIVLTLLISVRVQRIDPSAPLDPGSLMTQTEAADTASGAPAVEQAPVRTDARPRVLTLPRTGLANDSRLPAVSLTEDVAEGAGSLDPAADCAEILVLIRDSAAETHRPSPTRDIERIVRTIPCPRV